MKTNRHIVVLLVCLGGCALPSPSRLPPDAIASDEDSEESREAAVLRTAAKDLACPEVKVLLRFMREYANTTQPRFVVQGCDKRAVYAEGCAEYPRCRYLLLSVLQLSTVGAVP